jgi:hypothetical protein
VSTKGGQKDKKARDPVQCEKAIWLHYFSSFWQGFGVLHDDDDQDDGTTMIFTVKPPK